MVLKTLSSALDTLFNVHPHENVTRITFVQIFLSLLINYLNIVFLLSQFNLELIKI